MAFVKRGGVTSSEMDTDDEEYVMNSGELAQQFMRSVFDQKIVEVLTNRNDADVLSSFPANVRSRVRALRSLQKDFFDLEAKFYSEVHLLECKYGELYKPLLEKRAKIINGLYEPTEEECQNPWREESEEEDISQDVQKINIADGDDKAVQQQETETKSPKPPMDPNVKGIPDFWYTIFRNIPMLSDMTQEHDEPILKCLEDIKVIMKEDPFGFVLEFHFAPNEYFTNTVLTKEYHMKCKPDDDNPLEFEGPEIYACKGCEINWNKGKNVTLKTIKKKQKHKSRGSVRIITKSVQADSFFNFFSPPVASKENDHETQAILTEDFEIGHYIRERVVSRAVLLYTGEGLEEDDDDYEEEEDSYSDEDSGTEEVSDMED